MNAPVSNIDALERAVVLAREYRMALQHPNRFRVSEATDQTIFYLHLKGWSPVQIARELGVRLPLVKRRVVPGYREESNRAALAWWREHRRSRPCR